MIVDNCEQAKKMFLHYNGSYFHMQREECLEQYMKFNISKKEERKCKRKSRKNVIKNKRNKEYKLKI